MAEAFYKILVEYSLLNKIGWITTDNASANDTMIKRLEDLIFADNEIKLGPRHARCICHVINLVVQDLIVGFDSQTPGVQESETEEKPQKGKRLSVCKKPKKK